MRSAEPVLEYTRRYNLGGVSFKRACGQLDGLHEAYDQHEIAYGSEVERECRALDDKVPGLVAERQVVI